MIRSTIKFFRRKLPEYPPPPDFFDAETRLGGVEFFISTPSDQYSRVTNMSMICYGFASDTDREKCLYHIQSTT